MNLSPMQSAHSFVCFEIQQLLKLYVLTTIFYYFSYMNPINNYLDLDLLFCFISCRVDVEREREISEL